MDKFTELWPSIFGVLVIVFVWFVLRRILGAISDKINNSEVNREETLKVLEEIREELKELNRKNS
jgi:F0F1-type ATP synthase membrane subunit b/b'